MLLSRSCRECITAANASDEIGGYERGANPKAVHMCRWLESMIGRLL